MTTDLDILGDAIQAAATRDLGRATPSRRPLRGVAALGLTCALILPAAGYAAGLWSQTGKQEQAALPRGEALFAGSDPQCRRTSADSFHCTLATPPTAEQAASWLGAKEPSVDDQSRVDGGCVGDNALGTEWDCYLGQEAVDRGVIDAGVLGTERSAPGHG
jgi:hypothetical protein